MRRGKNNTREKEGKKRKIKRKRDINEYISKQEIERERIRQKLKTFQKGERGEFGFKAVYLFIQEGRRRRRKKKKT